MKRLTLQCIQCALSAAFLGMVTGQSGNLGNGPLALMALNYIYGSFTNVPLDIQNPPRNRNDSVGYRVYTQEQPDQPCFLEPTLEALRRCPIDPDFPLVLLVSGFIEKLYPGNLYEVMKDKILANGPYTVIILDWTKYDGPPVSLAIKNMKLIGPLAADMLKFITKHAGVPAENMRLTGHSLGGHLVGYIGRNIPNLGLIDSLDPAGIFYTTPPFEPKISYKDAKFVRVYHTSNEFTSLGTDAPLGHLDVYFNGGILQPHCEFGAKYTRTSGDVVTLTSLAIKAACPHELMNTYYIDSINSTECKFYATKCDSYLAFKDGRCSRSSSLVADVGFYGKVIPDLPPKSKFYLRTSSDPNYCLKDGYKP